MIAPNHFTRPRFAKTRVPHWSINLVLLPLYQIAAAVAAVVQSCECYR